MSATINSNINYYRKNFVDDVTLLVRSGPTDLIGFMVHNPDAANIGYLQLFNAASKSEVILGTTIPDDIIGVAAKATERFMGNGLPYYHFSKGLVVAATTTAGGSTAATTAFDIVLKYK